MKMSAEEHVAENDLYKELNLPEGYRYSGFLKKGTNEYNFSCLDLRTTDDIKAWVKIFGEKTYVEWRVRATFPKRKHFKIRYRCQHGSAGYKFKKSPSKTPLNTNCPASLVISQQPLGTENDHTLSKIILVNEHIHILGQSTAPVKTYLEGHEEESGESRLEASEGHEAEKECGEPSLEVGEGHEGEKECGEPSLEVGEGHEGEKECGEPRLEVSEGQEAEKECGESRLELGEGHEAEKECGEPKLELGEGHEDGLYQQDRIFCDHLQLPEGYRYSGFLMKGANEYHFSCMDLTTADEVKAWVKLFSEKTYVEWRVRSTFPKRKHFKVRYRCEHGSPGSELKRSSNQNSINTNCPALLILSQQPLGTENDHTFTKIILVNDHIHLRRRSTASLKAYIEGHEAECGESEVEAGEFHEDGKHGWSGYELNQSSNKNSINTNCPAFLILSQPPLGTENDHTLTEIILVNDYIHLPGQSTAPLEAHVEGHEVECGELGVEAGEFHENGLYEEELFNHLKLPEGYTYGGFLKKGANEYQFSCMNLITADEVKTWVKQLSEKNFIEWRVSQAFPKRKNFMVRYKCLNGCPDKNSVNTKCPAYLTITREVSENGNDIYSQITLMDSHDHSKGPPPLCSGLHGEADLYMQQLSLPDGFQYYNFTRKGEAEYHFSCCNLNSSDEIKNWVKELGNKTSVGWRISNTFPHRSLLKFCYVCQHSLSYKALKNPVKRQTKKIGCPARLKIWQAYSHENKIIHVTLKCEHNHAVGATAGSPKYRDDPKMLPPSQMQQTNEGVCVVSENDYVHSRESDACNKCIRDWRDVCGDVEQRIKDSGDSGLMKSVDAFCKRYRKFCKTDNALRSAFRAFAKFGGFKKMASATKIGVRPTAISRRTSCLKGKRRQRVGWPCKSSIKNFNDHDYCPASNAKKRKRDIDSVVLCNDVHCS